jgi:hypothetical protein
MKRNNSTSTRIKLFPLRLKGVFNKLKQISSIESLDEEFSNKGLDIFSINEHGENMLFEVSVYK